MEPEAPEDAHLVPDCARNLSQLERRGVHKHESQHHLEDELRGAVVHAVSVGVGPLGVPLDVHVGHLVRHLDTTGVCEAEDDHHVGELLQVGVVRHRLRRDGTRHVIDVQPVLDVLNHVSEVISGRRDVQVHGKTGLISGNLAVEESEGGADAIQTNHAQVRRTGGGVVVVSHEIFQSDVVQRIDRALTSLRASKHRIHAEGLRRGLLRSTRRGDVLEPRPVALRHLVANLMDQDTSNHPVCVTDVSTTDIGGRRGVLFRDPTLQHVVSLPIGEEPLRARPSARRGGGGARTSQELPPSAAERLVPLGRLHLLHRRHEATAASRRR